MVQNNSYNQALGEKAIHEHCTQPGVTIRDLYPHLNDEQLQEAKETLTRYAEHLWRVYQRILADPEASARFKVLTTSGGHPTLRNERSNAKESKIQPRT